MNDQEELTREHPLLLAFLKHLVLEECWTAIQILDVVEKPWCWQDEFELWQREVWNQEAGKR